jgi:hypothetical protein
VLLTLLESPKARATAITNLIGKLNIMYSLFLFK